MTRPLALTSLGDRLVIGPDITLAAWLRRAELGPPSVFLLADPDFARRRVCSDWKVPLRVTNAEDAAGSFQALPVVLSPTKATAAPAHPDSPALPAGPRVVRAPSPTCSPPRALGRHQPGRKPVL